MKSASEYAACITQLTDRQPIDDTPNLISYFKALPWVMGTSLDIQVEFITIPNANRLECTPTENGYIVKLNTVWGVNDVRYSAALAAAAILDGEEFEGVRVTPHDTVFTIRGLDFYRPFIHQLLMPEHQIRAYVKGDVRLSDVVERFQVFESDAKDRLSNLGLYTPELTTERPKPLITRRRLLWICIVCLVFSGLGILSSYLPDRPIMISDIVGLGLSITTGVVWWAIYQYMRGR